MDWRPPALEVRMHQAMAGALFGPIHAAVTNGYSFNQACEVQLSDRTTRVPDILILRPGVDPVGPDPFVGEDLAVAIDIEPVASVFRLEDGAYVEVSRGPRIEVDEPFPFAVDLAELLRR